MDVFHTWIKVASYTYTKTENPSLNTYTNPHLHTQPVLCYRRRRLTLRVQATATSIMPSCSQTACGPSSNFTPLPANSSLIFELNQARRAKVTREVETLRSGTCLLQPFGIEISCNALTHAHSSSSGPPAAFLDWPTVEGFEAFVEKRVEYGEMMDDHVSDVQAVIHEQLVIVEGLKKAAKLAEERRLQEFRRALERMSPAEVEAAHQAERERSLRLQKEREARAAALDAGWARVKAQIRAESPYESADAY